MITRILTTALILLVAIPIAASAHEGKTHGTTIAGTVKTLTNDTLVVTTEAGDVSATLTPRTTFVDAEERAFERSAIQPGDHVMISGSKLPGGGLSAAEVVVHSTRTEPPAGAAH